MTASIRYQGLIIDIWTGIGLLAVVCRLNIGCLGEPSFDETPDNVTVIAGHNAILKCSINLLGKYKVVWLDQRGFALTYKELRVIDDLRFSVLRPFIKEWNLQIADVRDYDHGQYRCTINTQPIRIKTIDLVVRVPPQIDDSRSSYDVTTKEGATVVLECYVTGVPQPKVTWYRRLVAGVATTNAVENLGTVGERFHIYNITRYCSHTYFVYECQASNGVPPVACRQIRLTVEYAPKATITNSTIGQSRGRDVILECHVTAFPLEDHFWENEGKQIYASADKFSITETRESEHRVMIQLTIRNLCSDDIGEYRCVARNRRGWDEAMATVYVSMESVKQQSGLELAYSSSQRPLSATALMAKVKAFSIEKNSQSFNRRMTGNTAAEKGTSAAQKVHIQLPVTNQLFVLILGALVHFL